MAGIPPAKPPCADLVRPYHCPVAALGTGWLAAEGFPRAGSPPEKGPGVRRCPKSGNHPSPVFSVSLRHSKGVKGLSGGGSAGTLAAPTVWVAFMFTSAETKNQKQANKQKITLRGPPQLRGHCCVSIPGDFIISVHDWNRGEGTKTPGVLILGGKLPAWEGTRATWETCDH